MDSWNDFLTWFGSADAQPALYSAAVTAVAILVSVIVSGLIVRGAIRALINRRDRDAKGAAIAALVDASTEAAVWSSLSPQEQILADRAVAQADIALRLLPIPGAALAANWSAHQLGELKRNSAAFGFQLDPVVAEFRDRLIEWQNKPRRAKKIFEEDIQRWRTDVADSPRVTGTPTEVWVDSPAVSPGAALGADTRTQQLIDDVAAIDPSARTATATDPERNTPHPI
ncbi:hypothetical protein D9V32_11105 [Mycetocola tolaasinivorans]|uniref:Uncharacterized protein n=1 Tax=Mycetocola tolaasinivorans TaxID=76635 RepID=A0A3L7A6I5_9MICO|nr:hypothetical protein [Mycetocola tolaasinivorans]RLP74972.1 hypothetical protein D9V32_11105 [Mycetocola tolaasinivorans]